MKIVKRLRILALLTLVLVFSGSLVATTVSRYVAKTSVSYKGETDLDYTVNSVFEVRSQEELFAAINQGYTYIQLHKDVENPLVITQQATNLEADLILDLNGIEIQRNGPEPILNIGPGVKLTVTDTSAEQTGVLYNPVGSVFNITGGTLSVVTGNFESGPRYSEYLSYNHDMLSAGQTTERTVIENEPQLVNLTINKKDVNGVIVPEHHYGTYMPIIRSYPVNTGEIIYTQGNLYCDKSITLAKNKKISFDQEETGNEAFYIPRDTFLYYSISKTGAGSALLNNPEDAEWFCTYFVYADTYAYCGANRPDDYELYPDKYAEITIYAYCDTILEASKVIDPKQYYAAIQMQDGSLEVQNGSFFSYFGLPTTACVNASGGTIKVGKGVFSSRIPDAASLDALDIKQSDRLVFDDNYFNNFKWVDSGFGTGSRAGQGLSYCILNHGEATVTINSGAFYSSNHNIISMQGGSLEIKEGEFYMTRTVNAVSASPATAAVYMKDGSLSLSNAEYYIKGDNTYAIYSTVNTDIVGNSFNVTDTSFALMDGNNQIGIYTERGLVQLNSTKGSNSKITIDGLNSVGILAENGGSVTANNYDLLLKSGNSVGILSTSGSVDMAGGSITLNKNDSCYGIYANSNEAISIRLTGTKINVGYNDATSKTGTVAASIGVFMASSNNDSHIVLDGTDISSYEIGIALKGGSLTLENGGAIRTVKASAIDLEGGTLTLNDNAGENAVYTVVSSNTNNSSYLNSYNLRVPALGSTFDLATYVDYENLHGIYVSGGNFVCNGKLDYVHTGLQNSPYVGGSTVYVSDKCFYNYLKVRSYAVCVEGGSVTVKKCDIEALSGGGVYCSGGNIIMGEADRTGDIDVLNSLISVQATGSYAMEGKNGWYYATDYAYDNMNAYGGWSNRKSLTGGNAIELNGGNITVYYGIFNAEFGNGLQVTGNSKGDGVINIHNGRFTGFMNGTMSNGTKHNDLTGKTGPTAHYGLKVMGAATVNIYNGVFDGGNGGAFITGIDKYTTLLDYGCTAKDNGADIDRAYVYVYEGEFGHEDVTTDAYGNVISRTGPGDAFNVYDNATVVFGAYTASQIEEVFGTGEEAIEKIKSAINVMGLWSTVAINPLGDLTSTYTKEVYIYYGDYHDIGSGDHGIYTAGYSSISPEVMNGSMDYDFILQIFNVNIDNALTRILKNTTYSDEEFAMTQPDVYYFDPSIIN